MSDIDYGRYPLANGQLPNRDPKTGIRYGIIPRNRLGEGTLDSFEPDYGPPTCPKTGEVMGPDESCPHCKADHQPEDCFPDEPLSWEYQDEEYSLRLDDSGDVWVFRSPFVTHAAHCSPCAPGAGYLIQPGPVLCYALGPDWFDNYNPVPYTMEPAP